LIFNATEAMPRGGRIEIKTFHRKGNAHIEISDTGTGMAEEIRKRVFEPFFTTKPFTNSGLGLSMSYGIIKRHGGDIEVKSRVGEGTTLFVVLPLDPPGEDLPSVSPARRQQEDAAIPGH
jgi:two-component system NtrC family sensor kinase